MSDRDIIESYYRQHHGELLTFVGNRLGGDVPQAEDLVHDIFLRLLDDAGRRPICESTVDSLVYTMARHLIADYYRRHRCQQEYARLMRGFLPSEFTIEPKVFAQDIMHRMEQGLRRLPQPCAQVYRLHILDGMKTAEIARELQLDYKVVEYRLGQARREVRQRLLRYKCS